MTVDECQLANGALETQRRRVIVRKSAYQWLRGNGEVCEKESEGKHAVSRRRSVKWRSSWQCIWRKCGDEDGVGNVALVNKL